MDRQERKKLDDLIDLLEWCKRNPDEIDQRLLDARRTRRALPSCETCVSWMVFRDEPDTGYCGPHHQVTASGYSCETYAKIPTDDELEDLAKTPQLIIRG